MSTEAQLRFAMHLQDIYLVCMVLVAVRGCHSDSCQENQETNSYIYLKLLSTSIKGSIGYQTGMGNDENVFSPRYYIAMKPGLSTTEECTRLCRDDEKPRYCYYHFTLENYVTMNRACESCRPNNTNQRLNVPQCQCIEADGFERGLLSINRMLPGPSIQVCERDKIIVDVLNNIIGSGVTIHWHGVFQQDYQYNDGVPFITQCPIPHGATFRYNFGANNAGTHYYHSHTAMQRWDGIYGQLIVRQSATADPHSYLYDYDLPEHVILISDWKHEMAIEVFPGRNRREAGQTPQNLLINGKGRWKDITTDKPISTQLESFNVKAGGRYRFRLINAFSSVCPAEITVEGHSVSLIAQDGTPVLPVPVNTISLSAGERVDFILNANQSIDTYWIQLRAFGECKELESSQVAILRYAGGPEIPSSSEPDYHVGLTRGRLYNPIDASCDVHQGDTVCAHQLESLKQIPEELLKPQPDYRIVLPFQFHSFNNSFEHLFEPGTYRRFLVAAAAAEYLTSIVDGISYIHPRVPPLVQPITSADTCNRYNMPKNCDTPCECTHTHHLKKGAIVEVVIYDQMSKPLMTHPYHLHGYAFHLFQIGRSTMNRNLTKSDINNIIRKHESMLEMQEYRQPPEKDTVVVPLEGYAIFRFKADNPGWWFFHCHILVHVVTGMNVVFHVGEQEDLPPVPPNFPTCHSYVPDIEMPDFF